MKVGIIGAGFVGLAAGVELVDRGHEVVIFEAGKSVGGLAGGFRPSGWKWSLEKFYHHIFFNDEAIIKMAKRVRWPAQFYNPKTDTYKNGVIAELDSPLALLKYRQLSVWGRLRMAVGLAALKVVMWPSLGVSFERFKVVKLLPLMVGRESYEKIWEPLLLAKFGSKLPAVNMAWFWARIVKRTKKLGYFRGGFEQLAERMAKYVTKKRGEIRLGTLVRKIKKTDKGIEVDGERFDRVIVTVPGPVATKLLPGLRFPRIEYLWGQTLILELKESLMKSYWLNILEREWPFLVVVEQTRLIDKTNYGGRTIIYVGNYLNEEDERLKLNEGRLLELFEPQLKKINPSFRKSWVNRMWKFQAPFAQPVFPINYSRDLPGIETEIPGVYIANMSMVYPWDRGTNYAVELGVRVASEI